MIWKVYTIKIKSCVKLGNKGMIKKVSTKVYGILNKLSSRSFPANISTLFQRCSQADMTPRRRTTSNQSWNNVVYVNVGIYNVEQCRINLFYFNVDLNNVRQRRHNVDIFNVDLHNVEPRWNNVVNMTIEKNEETNFESRTQ